MHVVAIHETRDDESRAGALASALGKSAYEARVRLRAAGDAPAVVANFADGDRAAALAAALVAAGFAVLTLDDESLESDKCRFLVSRVLLQEGSLKVDERGGRALEIPCGDIEFMISGMGILQLLEAETLRDRKFSLGKAIMTGGLKMTKVTETKVESRAESRERFLHFYASGRAAVVLRESSLDFSSLGPLLQPSRAANFSLILGELRRRCPGAPLDESLLTRQGQARLLGPSLTPEEHLDVAISLLAKGLRVKAERRGKNRP